MKIYPSKIGLELIVPITIILGGVGVLIIYQRDWTGLIPLFLLVMFLAYMFLTTRYTVSGEILTIRCGFLFKRTIDIMTIKKIAKTRNPISAPAASLDRIEISYHKFDRVIISPKDKIGFILQIKKINPAIELNN